MNLNEIDDEAVKEQAIKWMKKVIENLENGSIRIEHVWPPQNYPDADEKRFWFSISWEEK